MAQFSDHVKGQRCSSTCRPLHGHRDFDTNLWYLGMRKKCEVLTVIVTLLQGSGNGTQTASPRQQSKTVAQQHCDSDRLRRTFTCDLISGCHTDNVTTVGWYCLCDILGFEYLVGFSMDATCEVSTE